MVSVVRSGPNIKTAIKTKTINAGNIRRDLLAKNLIKLASLDQLSVIRYPLIVKKIITPIGPSGAHDKNLGSGRARKTKEWP
jgi:hypothetical protein